MKRFLLAFLIFTGCAYMRGQVDYTGPAAEVPNFHIVTHHYPELGISTLPHWTYDYQLVVENPTSKDWRVSISCNDYTVFKDFLVPAKKAQYFLLARQPRVRCKIVW